MAALSLRETFRAFTRQKSIVAVGVGTLALGISVCTAMLCSLYGVISRPLSFGDPRRLVVAWAGYEGGTSERDQFSDQALAEWRRTTRAFENVAGFRWNTYTLLQRGEPISIEGGMVSPELFSVLTTRFELGTAFGVDLVQATGGKVALISTSLWKQRFNADRDVVGKPINLGGEVYTITGVLPADFDVPSQKTAVWVPLMPPTPNVPARRQLYVFGKLRPSVTFAQAQADADVTAAQLAAQSTTNRGMRIHLVPFFEELTNDSWRAIVVATAAAFLTLLICCANVSNLLLVRAIARRPEFATRVAIGAERRHLLSVVLVESLVIAVAGGIVGAGLSLWLIDTFVRFLPFNQPHTAAIGRGLQIPLVAIVLIVLSTLFVSVPAAWEVARPKAGAGAGALGVRGGTSRRFARQFIVAVEIAIALTLVVGAGLMARTVLALRDSNPGWKSDHVLAGVVVLPRKTYQQPRQFQQFFDTFIERLRATAGVVSVGASSSLPAVPIGADFAAPVQVAGGGGPTTGQANVRIVTPGLFKTLGIPVLQGRDFDERDGGTPRRLIVNQAFVSKYLPDTPAALGRPIVVTLGPPETYEIVGVVGDVHHYGILQKGQPEIFIPFAGRPFFGLGIAVRTVGDPLAFAPVFRKELWALDPEIPVASADSMDDVVANTWKDRSMLTTLMLSFSVVVVLLTAIGIFSVVRFSVSRQVREIAIHMAIGAQGEDVVRLVMWQSARPVAVGVLLGLAGAWAFSRSLATLVYGGSASDPRMLVAGVVGIVAIAAIGAYLPSRRAARLDPVVALRLE